MNERERGDTGESLSGNSRFQNARARVPQATPPIWLMRQAGRYLPEYRATRARAGSFMGLATNVQYAT